MKTLRIYAVWVKGKRISTERLVEADHRDNAIFKFARDYGVKTFQCDAVWIKGK